MRLQAYQQKINCGTFMKALRSLRRFCGTVGRHQIARLYQGDDDFLNSNHLIQIEVPHVVSSATSDQLTLLFSSLVSPVSILNSLEQYQRNIEHHHCVLIIRILSRYPEILRQHRSDALIMKRFQLLINLINQNLRKFNEIDMVDILYSLRKFYLAGLELAALKYIDQQQYFSLLNNYIEKNKYQVRYLINIHFDFSFLAQPNDHVAALIVQALYEEKNTDELNFISFLTILKAVIQKQFQFRKLDQELLYQAVSWAERFFGESDVSQQGSFHFELARMRYQMLDPKFQLGSIFVKLQNSFLKNISRLQEMTIVQIVEAYGLFPKTYPRTLLEEINKMVKLTCHQNPGQMRMEFVQRMVYYTCILPEEMIDLESLSMLTNIIFNRQTEGMDPYFKQDRYQRYLEICILLINKKIPLDKEMIPILEKQLKFEHLITPNLLLLNKLFKVDIQEHLKQIPYESIERMPDLSLFYLGLLMSEYGLPSKQLKHRLYDQIRHSPLHIFGISVYYDSSPYYEEIIQHITTNMQIFLQNSHRNDQMRRVARTIINEKIYQQWVQWFIMISNKSSVKDNIEKFFSASTQTQDHIEIPYHGKKLLGFILKQFDKSIDSEFYLLLIRYQPGLIIFLVQSDPLFAGTVFKKLSIYQSGVEFARFLYLLEIHDLQNELQNRDFDNQIQQAINLKVFSNQFVYYMIKYCKLPMQLIPIIYNELENKKDIEMKLLLLLIEMFKHKNMEQFLPSLIIDQTNLLNDLYKPN